MSVHLENTSSSAINIAISGERFRQGSSAIGRVLTLIVVADETTQSDAVLAAVRASREHPCRILLAVARPGKQAARLDAEVSVGGADGLGEVVKLRMRGELAQHTDSVLLPLLVPDAPVVAWWPGDAPAVPALDPIGRLAQRRITDANAGSRPLAALSARQAGYRGGDTDLAWTRTTPWRALIASSLDQPYDQILGGTVEVQKSNPSGSLLAAWLQHFLQVPIELVSSKGPGVTAVTLTTVRGDMTISRPDGRVAIMSRPGSPDREAALHRRGIEDLIMEELRRLDADEIYGVTLGALGATAPKAPKPRRVNVASRPDERAAIEQHVPEAPSVEPVIIAPAVSSSTRKKSAARKLPAASKKSATKSAAAPQRARKKSAARQLPAAPKKSTTKSAAAPQRARNKSATTN
jgi:glucose-6-phosphate dehydrogenase assembly protein OpcA